MSEEVISKQDAAARKEQDVAAIREEQLGDEAAGGRWRAHLGFFEDIVVVAELRVGASA